MKIFTDRASFTSKSIKKEENKVNNQYENNSCKNKAQNCRRKSSLLPNYLICIELIKNIFEKGFYNLF